MHNAREKKRKKTETKFSVKGILSKVQKEKKRNTHTTKMFI